MKKILIAIAMLASILVAHAQNGNRADTTLLGVYNTGSRFTVTRADFGSQAATDLIGEMVLAFDTVKVITTATDSSRSKQKHSYAHTCNYISGLRGNAELFKDKIVLMALNKDCDVTQVCLLAQRSGAKAFMFIHNSNSNGNIKLPKKGQYPDSIRIPIFVVGNEKGENIAALLPSMAGIKTKVPPPLSRVAHDSVTTNVFVTKQAFDTEGGDLSGQNSATTTESLTNGTAFGKQGFTVSPNPTRNQTNITYQFVKPTDVTVNVEAETGQVVFSKILRGATVGNLEIQTSDWATGTYFVTLQYGKEVKTKKLVVRH